MKSSGKFTPAPIRYASKRKLVRGFTLIELLFVIIIIGILISVSIPAFRNTFGNLQLSNASSRLESFMNYCAGQAVAEGKIIYFDIDAGNRKYRAGIKDAPGQVKSYSLPEEIGIETDLKQVLFYPDGSIDKVTLKLTHFKGGSVTLTTKGVYGRVRKE